MYRALVIKELRETAWIVILAAGAFVASFWSLIGYGFLDLSKNRVTTIPFADGNFVTNIGQIAAIFAIVLGLRQSAWESLRATTVFLLYRPVARGTIFAIKLSVGLSLLLIVSGLALLSYAAWAASPGTHASPFYWSMTVDSAILCLAMTAVYLGAFAAGIRPGRLFGSRPFPLIAAAVPFVVSSIDLPVVFRVVFILAVDLLGLAAIANVFQSRDYP